VPVYPCRLCGETKELRESHILPGFVFRWQKETSATGYLRSLQQPNRRVQHGPKLPLLCGHCEQRFNQWETEFAKRIFHPMTQGDAARASYGPWLLLFCASVSWRVLVFFKEIINDFDHIPTALLPTVERAEIAWREFLLSSRPRPQPHEQHILPLPGGVIQSYTHSNMPANINRYLFRTPDISVATINKGAFTYSKLGPFIILGFLVMPRPKQWVGTRVNTHGGILRPREYVMPKPFDEFLFDRANKAADVKGQISEKQTAKIAEAYRANMDRAAQSDLMRVIHQDVQLFGRRAFKGE
jgi:hypothetical protein